MTEIRNDEKHAALAFTHCRQKVTTIIYYKTTKIVDDIKERAPQ